MNEQQAKYIQERAFFLWEAEGGPEGRDLDYWLRAEQEVLTGSSFSSAADISKKAIANSAKKTSRTRKG
ncbi:MAG: hypothetical protein A3G18_05345 [Rhodospirillales bacterium RIFCSPLOWO2_12_FULL_58_28]|nr:MAG: hypothetical protein A3H92_05440 [Rhodospirillales bacterium RIFCSPLOWO2_02_FULL_58_16]OHC78329.1 MAG: hypothetical protein A3G18_05345 [Rhodospirillales bacterium RIFCSPLOWO2_12_FULL_58_28]